MKIIRLKNQDIFFNLAAEEYIFFNLDNAEKYFLLWQNQNAVVIGKHQNPIEEINLDFVESNQVQVARRLSGGGAVYHDLGNLNYSIIVHSDEMRWDINRMADPIVKALGALGVNVHLNKRNDLLIDGKKISGSSQYIKGKRLLHHGTLLFHADLKFLSLTLKPGDDLIESRSIKSVRSPVTNINDQYPNLTIEEFISKLREVLAEDAVIEDYEMTDSDLEAISVLREEKYSTWEWIYGRSPEYSIRKEREFDGIEMEILLKVKNGIIQAVKLDGDFRLPGDIEKSLIDVRLIEKDIFEALSAFDVDFLNNENFVVRLASMIAR